MTCMCFMAFALVLKLHGLNPSHLWWTNLSPNSGAVTVEGHHYTNDQITEILFEAQTAYWAILTGTQVFHIFLCKTRFQSLFTKGIFSNPTLLYGVGVEIALIVLIIFVPSSHLIFQTANDNFPGPVWGVLGLSWFLFFFWHEGVKFAKREWPNSFVKHLLY